MVTYIITIVKNNGYYFIAITIITIMEYATKY